MFLFNCNSRSWAWKNGSLASIINRYYTITVTVLGMTSFLRLSQPFNGLYMQYKLELSPSPTWTLMYYG